MADAGLLDTIVFIGLEAKRAVRVALLPTDKYVFAITAGELRFGVLVAETPNSILARSASFEVAMSANVLPVDAAAAEHWGHLTAQVKKTGRKAGLNDLWIAATAAANDLVVFTQDEGFAALRDLGGPAVVIV